MTVLLTLYFFLLAKNITLDDFPVYFIGGLAFDAFIMAAIALQLAMK